MFSSQNRNVTAGGHYARLVRILRKLLLRFGIALKPEGKLGQRENDQVERTVSRSGSGRSLCCEDGSRAGKVAYQALDDYRRAIDALNASQPNKDLLDDIRSYNHTMINQFNSMRSLRGSLLLEIGASPHGYALERALELGVTLYVGIGLDVTSPGYVRSDRENVGLLLNMDATTLQFPTEMFDAIFSISTFEHILDVETALSEIARVLKPEGLALVSFEPIWSCSYGHHLHHFGECAKCIPPWGHLIWGPDQMRQVLAEEWPTNAPLPLDDAINWIYHDNSINRLDIRSFIKVFNESALEVEWMVKIEEEEIKNDLMRNASIATGLSPEELRIKGLSVLLSKQGKHISD